MARIFISHSSANNAEAIALRDWLASEGWDDVFLDLDPERGIVAGERWERALNEAACRCEAVIFLVTRAWLGSRWCLKELNLAHRLNKRLFGVLIEDIPIAELPPDLTSTWQLVNLASGSDHQLFRALMPDKAEEAHVTFSTSGLARLKGGLTKAGLDARFFAWPPAREPNRPPYRGLKPLEAEDAGIFFGREAPVIEALDRLRGLADAAPPRFLVILGASGAGKSSFLRAGLLPRLNRDDRHFLPLPVIRPDRAALTGETGLVRSLDAAFQAQGSRRARADVKAAIDGGAQTLLPLLTTLAENACPPSLPDMPAPKPPALVLSIDQGEELFLAEGAEEAEKFLALIKDLSTAAAPDVIILVTIRSDSYERLQMAKALEGVKQDAMSLPPVPHGSYADIIEGPAQRLKDTPRALKIEPALSQALLTDIEEGGAKDALPLLAFTLERLYADYGGDGNLRLSEYEQLGRVKGSIEAAVESALAAAGADPKIPKDRVTRLALLRRGLIPWLAGIDPETGNPRRRVARLSEIPEDARPLVNLLVEQRLLATDVAKGTGEVTVEPAHEALLRQWGLLQTWLVEDSAALTALESVKRATRDWEANGKDVSWLTHAGGRLEDAERLRLRPDLAGLLGGADWAYLADCRTREAEEKEREEQRRKRELRRNRIIAYGSLAALVIVSVLGWFFWQQKREAVAQRMRAEGTVIAAAQGADQFIIDVAAKLRETAGLPLAVVGEFLKNAAKMLDQLHQYNADSPELARSRARFLREMSQTLLAANDTDSALASAEQSRDLMKKLLSQNPRDSKLRDELTLSYNRVGDALKNAGRHDEALDSFRRALAIREELAAVDTSPKVREDLAFSYERAADELFRSDADGASKLYEKSFAIRDELAKAEPGNPDRQEKLAVIYERLARLARERGDEGLELYRKVLATREKLVTAEPANSQFLASLGTTHDTIGVILTEMGRCGEALEPLRKGLAIRQELAAKAPDNADWQAKVAKSMYGLAVCNDHPNDRLTRASEILAKLDKEGKLPNDMRAASEDIQERLSAIALPLNKPRL